MINELSLQKLANEFHRHWINLWITLIKFLWNRLDHCFPVRMINGHFHRKCPLIIRTGKQWSGLSLSRWGPPAVLYVLVYHIAGPRQVSLCSAACMWPASGPRLAHIPRQLPPINTTDNGYIASQKQPPYWKTKSAIVVVVICHFFISVTDGWSTCRGEYILAWVLWPLDSTLVIQIHWMLSHAV